MRTTCTFSTILLLFVVFAFTACGGGGSSDETPITATSTIYTVPSTIDGTGKTDVTAALNYWIQTVPDGTASNISVIKFPAGNTYLLSEGIQFKDRSYLTFDGYGAKLKLNPLQDPITGYKQHQSLFLLGWGYNTYSGGTNKNIIIRGFEFEASNPTPAVWNADREGAHAVEIDNSDGVEVYDILAHGIAGDGFKTTRGLNLWIHNNHIQDAGRQGVTICEGDSILIENNQFDHMGYFILDLEPNGRMENNQLVESITNITFRNNTAGTWGGTIGGGLVAVGCGANFKEIGNITITGNTMTGSSYSTLCSYFNMKQYKRLYNIVFTNNKASQSAAGPAWVFKTIDGLTITGNNQPLSSGSLFSITDSTGVISTPNP